MSIPLEIIELSKIYNNKEAYILNFFYLVLGISLFYFSFLKARIKGTLINMGE